MAPLIIWGGGRSSLLQPTLSWQTFLLPKNTFQSASFILCARWPCVMNKADCVCMLLRFYLLVQVFRTKSNLFDVLHAYSVEKRLMLSLDQVIRDNSNSKKEYAHILCKRVNCSIAT